MKSIDTDALTTVTGGQFFTPASAALRVMGAPWRAWGRAFAPNTMRMMGAAAQVRHDIYNDVVHGGNPVTGRLHDNYVKSFYREFAPTK